MAAGQVTGARRGFTLLEVMTVVAIVGVLTAMGITAFGSAQRISRVSGQARLIVQRLQTLRTAAVSQGAAQGYFFGPNGPGATGANANTAFVFYKQNPAATAVSYVSATDRRGDSTDYMPTAGTEAVLVITGTGISQPNPFQVGFDMNGQVTVTPAPGTWPFCIWVSDVVEPSVTRRVILFNDGTVKVQNDETWCP